ncbi:unnamed protein product [Cyprideis torosa]|uniref:Uncharacterized protein n=1 Tax=Cyprideis torosa TaxID=163714 RepID=A0A7R8ZGH3_9CRUS|nr:unnamed protein product [Cyprideis torosa]CAG0880027.1 unnamed protein product [Cyprideis torosa]
MELRSRMFHSISDLVSLVIFLCVSPAVRDAYQQRGASSAGFVTAPVLHFRRVASEVQTLAMYWLFSQQSQAFCPTEEGFKYALTKMFMLKDIEHYIKVDSWPPDQERAFVLRVAQDIPVQEAAIMRLIVFGLTRTQPISFRDITNIALDLIRRTAVIAPLDGQPVLPFKNTDLTGAIFTLAHYQPPELEALKFPSSYSPIKLAHSSAFWKVWQIVLIITAHNPTHFGQLALEKFPMLHSLIEMCIVKEFQYPVASLLPPDRVDELKALETRRVKEEKAAIAEFESYFPDPKPDFRAAGMILLDPEGPPRRPPPDVLDELCALNATLKLGHMLSRSRDPDFLVQILETQDPRRSMPWLMDLVKASRGHFESLPMQCLCACLIHHKRSQAEDCSDDKADTSIRTALVAFLRQRLEEAAQYAASSTPDESSSSGPPSPSPLVIAAGEILEYFFRKLSAEERDVRAEAVSTLQLLLKQADRERRSEAPDEARSEWLSAVSPAGWLGSFGYLRPLFVECIRAACLVETCLDLLEAYICFLQEISPDDHLTALTMDLSQMVTDRSTITAALLPSNRRALRCLLSIFWRQLQLARMSGISQDPTDSDDWITVTWPNNAVASLPLSVFQATIVLLTLGPPSDPKEFSCLMNAWFPLPHATWTSSGETVHGLLPDWLKLRMIKSEVAPLIEHALRDLGPAELVLFVQSFGIPVGSMNKLLWALDRCPPTALKECIQNVPYMIQVLEVQRRRGATGGSVFEKFLTGGGYEPPRPRRGTTTGLQIPLDAAPTPQSYRRLPELVAKEALQSYLFCIYSLDRSRPTQPLSLRLDLTRKLMHTLRNEGSNGPVTRVFLEQMTLLCKSSKGREIMTAIHEQEQESCALFKIVFNGNNRNKKMEELAGPLPSLLIRHTPMSRLSVLLRSLFPTSPLPPAPTPILTIKASDLLEPKQCLKAARVSERERLLRNLVSRVLAEGQDCRRVVSAIAQLLLEDDGSTAGLWMDWIQELDLGLMSCSVPEAPPPAQPSPSSSSTTQPVMTINILGIKSLQQNAQCSPHETLQLKVLFSGKAPYLLSLLTHRASWNSIRGVVDRILGADDFSKSPSIDSASVLNFLEACLRNPNLWQGRDKDSFKSRLPKEDVLSLSVDEIRRIADFIVKEGRLDARLPLLLECCADHPARLAALRSHLKRTDLKSADAKVANQLGEKLYLRCPGMTSGLECPLDKVTHSLITALASSTGKGKGKEGLRAMEEVELCCRKVASSHPKLFARQLPLMSVVLHGRSHVEFPQFRARFHLYLFSCLLGLLELLVPHCFESRYAPALSDLLQSFGDIVARFGAAHRGEMGSFVDQLMGFLAKFATLCPARGIKELQKFEILLPRLLDAYRMMHTGGMASIQTAMSLLSRAPIQKGRVEQINNRSCVSSDEFARISFSRRHALSLSSDTDEEGVMSILQDFDANSSRCPSYLGFVLPEVASVLHSRRENVRRLAFSLVLRYLKQEPKDAPLVVDDYIQCLESPVTPEERIDALERLPEMTVLLQEFSSRILSVVHRIGVKERVSTERYFQETLRLMYRQIGL